MSRVLFALAAAAVLSLANPTDVLAQQKSKQLVPISTATESLVVATPDARTEGMVIGAAIGGLVGGAVTVGCLWLHGMGAPAALPYCVIPAIIGVALGAWVGGSVSNGRTAGAGAGVP